MEELNCDAREMFFQIEGLGDIFSVRHLQFWLIILCIVVNCCLITHICVHLYLLQKQTSPGRANKRGVSWNQLNDHNKQCAPTCVGIHHKSAYSSKLLQRHSRDSESYTAHGTPRLCSQLLLHRAASNDNARNHYATPEQQQATGWEQHSIRVAAFRKSSSR